MNVRDNQLVYRVAWPNGNPAIETGRVFHKGTQRQTYYCQFPAGRVVRLEESYMSIKNAIMFAIYEAAEMDSRMPPPLRRMGWPWGILDRINRLQRLYAKCKKHGLIH